MASVPLPAIAKTKKAKTIQTPGVLQNRATLYQAAGALSPYMSHTAHHILLIFCTFSNEDGTNCSPGLSGLMKRSNYSKPTITKFTEYFRKINILVPAGRGTWGQRKYRLNLPGHWMYDHEKPVQLPGLLISLPASVTPQLPAIPATPEPGLPDLPEIPETPQFNDLDLDEDLEALQLSPVLPEEPPEPLQTQVLPSVPEGLHKAAVEAVQPQDIPPDVPGVHHHEYRLIQRLLSNAQESQTSDPSREYNFTCEKLQFQQPERIFIWSNSRWLDASQVYRMWVYNDLEKWKAKEWKEPSLIPGEVLPEHIELWQDLTILFEYKKRRGLRMNQDYLELARGMKFSEDEISFIWKKKIHQIHAYRIWRLGLDQWQQLERQATIERNYAIPEGHGQ